MQTRTGAIGMKSQNRYSFGELTARILKNDLAGVAGFLSQGADPNERDSDGRTPLMHAAIDNKVDIAKALLKKGADVDGQDDHGYGALHFAAQNYFPEM